MIMMKSYWAPTPRKWRKLGDALLGVATIITLGGMWQFDTLKQEGILTPEQLKIIIVSSLILGVVGKFLTNFFSEDTQTYYPPYPPYPPGPNTPDTPENP